jgi:hypothetical protein
MAAPGPRAAGATPFVGRSDGRGPDGRGAAGGAAGAGVTAGDAGGDVAGDIDAVRGPGRVGGSGRGGASGTGFVSMLAGDCVGTGGSGGGAAGSGNGGRPEWPAAGAATSAIVTGVTRRGTPTTEASSEPHSGQDSRPYGTGTPHSGQTTIRVAMDIPP